MEEGKEERDILAFFLFLRRCLFISVIFFWLFGVIRD